MGSWLKPKMLPCLGVEEQRLISLHVCRVELIEVPMWCILNREWCGIILINKEEGGVFIWDVFVCAFKSPVWAICFYFKTKKFGHYWGKVTSLICCFIMKSSARRTGAVITPCSCSVREAAYHRKACEKGSCEHAD